MNKVLLAIQGECYDFGVIAMYGKINADGCIKVLNALGTLSKKDWLLDARLGEAIGATLVAGTKSDLDKARKAAGLSFSNLKSEISNSEKAPGGSAQ